MLPLFKENMMTDKLTLLVRTCKQGYRAAVMILQRYIWKELLGASVFALALMLGLVWLLQSLRFLDFIINKGLGVGTFLELTLMLIPMLLMIVWPLALFAGALYTLRRWQDDVELVALFSLGASPWWMLKPLVMFGLLGVAFAYLNSLVLLPMSTTAFKDMQHNIRNEQGHLLLEEGSFNQLGDDVMVFIKKRTGTASMEGLLVHDTRREGRPVTWMARKGDVTVDADGHPTILLQGGVRQEVNGGRVSMLEFAEHALDISERFAQDPLAPRMRESEEFSLAELGEAARTDPELRAEWHKKLLWPLAPLALTMMAAGWLLRPMPSRLGVARWIVAATACGVAYWVLMIVAQNLGGDGATWALRGQWLLPLGACAFGVWRVLKGGR
jgi:lipopolysaccharide export system permease protein